MNLDNENHATSKTFQKIGIPRNGPLGSPSAKPEKLSNSNHQYEIKIPIFKNHVRQEDHVVGWIKIKNMTMFIEFNDGHEPTYSKMQDLFGCAAGNVIRQTKDKRIKLFRVTAWGYK